MIKFNTQFQFEAGEKCEFGPDNPFADLPIIADIMPEDKSKDVHVFTEPQLAFNFSPSFEIEYISDDQSPEWEPIWDDEQDQMQLQTETRYFYYELEYFKLTYEDKNGEEVVWDIRPHMNYNDGMQDATFEFTEYLPPNQVIAYEIKATGWENKNVDEKIHTEIHEGTFTTGDLPDIIEDFNIVKRTPEYRQRYFLKGDHSEGTVELKKSQDYLFDKGSLANGTFKHVARFTHLITNEKVESPATINEEGDLVKFNLPQSLHNNSIYALDIVTIFTPPINQIVSNSSGSDAEYVDIDFSQEPIEGKIVFPEQGGQEPKIGQIVLPGQNNGPNNGNGLNLNLNAINNVNNNNNNIQMAQFNPNLIQQLQNNNNNNNNGIQPIQAQLINKNIPNAQDMILKGNDYDQKNDLHFKAAPMGKIEKLERSLNGQKKKVKKFEKVILNYHFRTSKFNTMQEKIATVETKEYDDLNAIKTFEFPTEEPNVVSNIPVIYLTVEENFDVYDVYGYKKQISGKVNPIFQVKHLESGNINSPDKWASKFWTETYTTERPTQYEWKQMNFMDIEPYQQNGEDLEVDPDIITVPNWNNYYPAMSDYHFARYAGKPYAFSRNHPSPDDITQGITDPFIEFYNPKKHGYLSFGTSYMKPQEPLYTHEIKQAEQIGNPPENNQPNPNPGLNNIQLNLNVMNNNNNQPNNGMLNNMNLNLQNNAKIIPMLDYTEWLSTRDFYTLREHVRLRNDFYAFHPDGGTYAEREAYKVTYFPMIETFVEHYLLYNPRPANHNYRFNLAGKTLFYCAPELEHEIGNKIH